MFKTISENEVKAEIVEKKSKFIANLFYVENVEEAENKIKQLKKIYFDARHNCFAYSIYTKGGIVNRFSDDGEPSGTAGLPMLNVLQSKKICNVLIIVTRYFGGILLGTGGLVRAYTGALQEALLNTTEIEKAIGIEAYIEVTYSDLEKAKYYISKKNVKMTKFDYNENVLIYIETIEKHFNDIINSQNDLNFEIIKSGIIKEKYIQI